MPGDPKVSVAITTYNQEAYIEAAVTSALSQDTGFDVEVVVSDDASGDRTPEILDELAARYPDRLRVTHNCARLGANRNFVETLDRCRGDYIALLDGDDYWLRPDKLRTQAEHLDRHPGCAVVFHPVQVVHDGGRPRTWAPPGGKRSYDLDDLLGGNFVANCSVMIRNAGRPRFPDWFDESAGMPGDWTFLCLQARDGSLDCLPETMAAYRVHDQGMWTSAAADRIRRLEATIEAGRRLADDLGPAHREASRRGIRSMRRKIALERTAPFLVGPLIAVRDRIGEVRHRVRR